MQAGIEKETAGDKPFIRSLLARLLRNRFYIGEINFKGEILKGEQSAIVDRSLFEAVQRKLDKQLNSRNLARNSSGALLTGRIFDDRGNKTAPTHSRRGHIKHRHYIPLPFVQDKQEHPRTINRIPADEVEEVIVDGK